MFKQSISLTAWVVIACHGALKRSSRWQSLVPDTDMAFYRAALKYCSRHSLLCRVMGLIPDRLKLWITETVLAKGAPQHFVLRKKAIAGQLQSCVSEGTTQLVVIGGGFDLLALKTAAALRQMECFELDMPGMQKHKHALLSEAYGSLPTNFHSIAADLSRVSLHEALSSQPAYDPSKQTFFVAEGLTMYLSEPHIVRLFSDTRRLGGKGSGMLFTAIERDPKPSAGFAKKLRNLFLSINKEQFRWSMTQRAIANFLKSQHYAEYYLVNYQELQRPYRSEKEYTMLKRQHGEYLVYAVADAN